MVRHGQSVWNDERRYQGHGDPGLSDRGHAQARDLARYLVASFGGFDAVVASDLRRVRETFRPWADRTGIEPTLDSRWREVDVGTWSGRTHDEIAASEASVLADLRRGQDVARGAGETSAAHRARIGGAHTALIKSIAERASPGEQLQALVFTHCGSIQVAAAEILDLPPMGHRWLIAPANCSVSVFQHGVDRSGRITSSLVNYAHDSSQVELV